MIENNIDDMTRVEHVTTKETREIEHAKTIQNND